MSEIQPQQVATVAVESYGIVITRCSGFFLLIQIEVEAPNIEIEPLLFIKLTDRQERILENSGVPIIEVVEPLLSDSVLHTGINGIALPGINGAVEFLCVFFASDKEAFLAFEVENEVERVVLVRVDICLAIKLVERLGLRRCTVIRCPFVE